MSMNGSGDFIEGVRWEVSMNFGERLHLKLAREPQYIYIPSLFCKVEEDRGGVFMWLK